MSEGRAEICQRLESAAGHVRGIAKMVDAEESCIDVIRLVEAVERSLHAVKCQLLGRHVDRCVATVVHGEDAAERERALRELLEAYDTYRAEVVRHGARRSRPATTARRQARALASQARLP